MQIYIITTIKGYKCISSHALKLQSFSENIFFNQYKIQFMKISLHLSVRNSTHTTFFSLFSNNLHAFPLRRRSELSSHRQQNAHIPNDGELKHSWQQMIRTSVEVSGRCFAFSQNTDIRNGHLHAGCISAPLELADDLACSTFTANYFSGCRPVFLSGTRA